MSIEKKTTGKDLEDKERTDEKPTEKKSIETQPTKNKATGGEPTKKMSIETETKPVENKPTEKTPTEEKPTEKMPTEETPTEKMPTQEKPTEKMPTEETPTEKMPTEETPTEKMPTQEKPTEKMPTEETPTEKMPTQEKPTEKMPTEETPTEKMPTEEKPREKTPTEEMPTEKSPTEEKPMQKTLTEDTPTQKTLAQETPAQKMSALEITLQSMPPKKMPIIPFWPTYGDFILKVTFTLACLMAVIIFTVWLSTAPFFKHAKTIYDFEAKNLNGQTKKLSQYTGYPMLIVCVSNKCGSADVYWQQLQDLYEKFRYTKKLRILAFPTAEFNRNPDEPSDFLACIKKYKVTFDVFSTVNVNGCRAHPLWKWLKTDGTEDIEGTPDMFVINKNGKFIHRFRANVKSSIIETKLNELFP
ncbi:repetitive proline-rich cell wall protein 2-like [Venturia canescens]|uniref:repetitive proline-rich cell wall protein 2-like n=1 Tax=Venturia canescens TaxID=32260 RepID=UPI001C9C060F|nr:repetitive proline-rich cell wall protein 2-like [Venturia canescens]XP_043286011.1 repetitive proline-rich cell wall protein 2-like [Venturia canescens]